MSSVLYAYLDGSGRRVLCGNLPSCRSGRWELAMVDEIAVPKSAPIRQVRLHPYLERVKGENLWKVPAARLKRLEGGHGAGLPNGTKGTVCELPTTVICWRCGQAQVLDQERLRVTLGIDS